jgi:CRP/FNR family transcriptional regulator, cyclic AMP receptor protein
MSDITIFRHAHNRKQYEAGTIIFLEGQPGDTMFSIIEGEVDLFVGEAHIATVGAGGIIGEMAMVSSHPRSATAITRTDSVLVAIDSRQFTFMIQQTPFFATQVMNVLAERVRETTNKIHLSPLDERAMVGRD